MLKLLGLVLLVVSTVCQGSSDNQKCHQDWYPNCSNNNDCCSTYCHRDNSLWTYGYCKPLKDQLKSGECREDWYDKCDKNDECCSSYCHRDNQLWAFGYCKPRQVETITTTETSPTVISRAKKHISARQKASLEKLYREALDVHNEYRAQHSCPKLQLNQELCEIALNRAKNLMTGLSSSEINLFKGQRIGENRFNSTKKLNVALAIQEWYGEIKDHDFNLDSSSRSRRFSQLVWKSTTDVGFGIAVEGGRRYFVAIYYPAGNIEGQYASNVPREIEKENNDDDLDDQFL